MTKTAEKPYPLSTPTPSGGLGSVNTFENEKPAFSNSSVWRAFSISMDGRPNRRNKAAFPYFSGVVLGFEQALMRCGRSKVAIEARRWEAWWGAWPRSPTQSRSQSLRSPWPAVEKRELWEQPFWNNRILPIGFTAQSASMAHAWNGCSQSSRFPTTGRGERRLWERDCRRQLCSCHQQWHPRPQRPRSFWSAPRIATSGKVQFSEHAQSNRFVFSTNQICQTWLWACAE